MIVTLIVLCEVGFWVLLAAGLATRYLLKMPRAGLALLLCEPLLEVVLLVATAIDLKNGADPSWKHGLAALYIGYTVGHGHRTVKWLDGHAAHRLGGGPRPPKPPQYGTARARYEGRIWLGTLVGGAVATVLLLAAMAYVGGDGDTSSLKAWMYGAWRAVGIHGVIALSYVIWPRKAPAGSGEAVPAARAEGARAGGAGRGGPGRGGAGVSARRPGPTARPRPRGSPSWQG
ncbi:hypothetical protein RGF97_09355 [Streptomyces roseicoloratus]|uniref:Integral membrane protein n=1 Tax=Streptomyces roseicoloratus TaxID=2508722 RepID=A0ABY9RS52_9ACTN|nr:hypothetical protein [Streptomyces roseicoloratus]WMX45018.1 hypothetical protein RGF97_09355 [Streptomyces roseicoloratus]